MKFLGSALLIAGLVLMAVPVMAADTGVTSVTLVGKPNAGDFAWFDGATANPTITVPANTEISWTVSSSDDTPHTLKVGTQTLVSTPISSADGPSTVKWTSGSADTTYECTLHSNMKGTVHIAGASATPAKSPGLQVFGVMVALAAVALLVGRRQS